MKTALFAGTILSLGLAQPALASEAGGTSTGSVAITVTIPPLGAALAASNAGAAGLWTVTDTHAPLMINLPAEVSEDAASSATMYHGDGVKFTVALQSEHYALTEQKSEDLNGLVRQSFAFISRSRESVPATTTPALFVVSGL